MRGLIKSDLAYPNLWNGCVGAWCPSVDRSRSAILTDWSPNRNHGVLTGMDAATDWVVSGGSGALDLDGTNDHITLGSQNSLKPTTAVSVSGFIFVAAAPVSFSRVASARASATSDGYLITMQSGGLTPGFAIGNGGVYSTAGSSTALTSLVWAHVAGTWDGNNVLIYVNGVNTGSTIKTAISYTAGNCAIGADPIPSGYFRGYIDDVRIYNRALAPSEIQLLARRRGIAYESRRNRSVMAPAGGGGSFKSYLAARNSQLISGGT